MGLPYESELREMIKEEEEQLRFLENGGAILDALPCAPYFIHVVFKGQKYTITASSFIRAIEPFNQKLCDILFRAADTISGGISPVGVRSIVSQAIHEMYPGTDLYYDPDFLEDGDVAVA